MIVHGMSLAGGTVTSAVTVSRLLSEEGSKLLFLIVLVLGLV